MNEIINTWFFILLYQERGNVETNVLSERENEIMKCHLSPFILSEE